METISSLDMEMFENLDKYSEYKNYPPFVKKNFDELYLNDKNICKLNV